MRVDHAIHCSIVPARSCRAVRTGEKRKKGEGEGNGKALVVSPPHLALPRGRWFFVYNERIDGWHHHQIHAYSHNTTNSFLEHLMLP